MSDELDALYQELQAPDWDGYGAVPVTAGAYEWAKKLIDAIPAGLPLPTYGAEPDGDITFEWWYGRNHVVNASVQAAGKVVYAAMIGDGCKCGTVAAGDAWAVLAELIKAVQMKGGVSGVDE